MRNTKHFISCIVVVAAVDGLRLAQAAVLTGDAYGLTNLAGILEQRPSSNTSINTGLVSIEDSNTGEGAGLVTGNLTGVLTSGSHACGEPTSPGGVESDGAGYGAVQLADTFQIRSTTLANGTPVPVEFCVIGALHHQEGDDLRFSSSQTETDIDATFRVSGSASNSFVGDFRYLNNLVGGGPRITNTGALFSGVEEEFTLNLAVGQSFEVLTGLTCDSTSSVDPGEVGDVQGQAAIVWGGDTSLSGVTIQSSTTGQPLPDMSQCTAGFADGQVPPPLVELPEPSAVMVLGIVLPLVRRRRAPERAQT